MSKPFMQYNETGALERILVKRPQEALQTQFLIDTNWQNAGWSKAPEFNAATQEHFRLIRFLQAQGVTVNYHDDDWIISMDSVFIRDTCLMTPYGVIQGCLHTPCRIPEPESVSNYIDQLGGPTIGKIEGPGQLSGSDVVWVNKDLLLIAESYLTNANAVEQVKAIFSEHEKLKTVKIVQVRIKRASSPSPVRDCLKNIISSVKENVLIVAPHKLESADIEVLQGLGLVLENVTEEEYSKFGASILVVNKFAACLPSFPELTRIKEEILEKKYAYKAYSMDYEHLGRGGMGIGSMIVALCRRDS